MLTRSNYVVYATAAKLGGSFEIINDRSPLWRCRNMVDNLALAGRLKRTKLPNWKNGYEYEITLLFWEDIEKNLKKVLFKLNKNESLCEQAMQRFIGYKQEWVSKHCQIVGVNSR